MKVPTLLKEKTAEPNRENAESARHELDFLLDLESVLKQRKQTLPAGSYSTRLFKRGIDKIAQKLGEEAVEVVIASKNKKPSETINESADLVYHLLVLLVEKDLSLTDVVKELKVRSKK